MKAAVLKEFDHIEIMDLKLPAILAPGQVVVEMKYSAICGKQKGELIGYYGPDKFLPHLFGHEGSGIVIACGPGVRTVENGDHVVLHWRKGDGIDAKPPKYLSNKDEIIGAGPVATFAERVVVSENRITPICKHYPFDIACLFGCSVTTGLGLIENEAKLKFGQSILVIGCGGVGLNIIQGASLVGAFVYAIDKNEKVKRLVVEYGVKAFDNNINYSPDGYFDVVVDCTGSPTIISKALEKVKPGGKLILVGQVRYGESVKFENFHNFYQGKIIIDSQGGSINPTVDIPRYFKLWGAKKILVYDLIADVFSLENINEAFRCMKPGKVLVKLNEG